MTDQPNQQNAAAQSAWQRWSIYLLIIICATFAIVGRVMMVRSNGSTSLPALSANDRSRWLTVWSLGDHGTYEWDKVFARMHENDRRHWNSIDRVVHADSNGDQKVYSSKPTLLPTILAGEYRLFKLATGISIESNPFFVIRTLLIINNCLFMFFYLVSIACIAERLSKRAWTRFFILLVAAFGTYLTTFAVTLNNHLPAAMSVAIALHHVVYIRTGTNGLIRFALCGLFAAFAAANELPATSFLLVVALLCFVNSIGRTFIAFFPAVAVVIGGFFWTNYLAHDTWRPAYSYRSDGEIVATVDADFEANKSALAAGEMPEALTTAIGEKAEDLDIEDTDGLQLFEGRWHIPEDSALSDRWVVADADGVMRAAITVENGENSINIRQWGNWYEYGYGGAESPWLTGNTNGFDKGEANQARYLVHLLIGHHGVFLITPVLLLAFFRNPVGLVRSQLFDVSDHVFVCAGFGGGDRFLRHATERCQELWRVMFGRALVVLVDTALVDDFHSALRYAQSQRHR